MMVFPSRFGIFFSVHVQAVHQLRASYRASLTRFIALQQPKRVSSEGSHWCTDTAVCSGCRTRAVQLAAAAASTGCLGRHHADPCCQLTDMMLRDSSCYCILRCRRMASTVQQLDCSGAASCGTVATCWGYPASLTPHVAHGAATYNMLYRSYFVCTTHTTHLVYSMLLNLMYEQG